MNPKNMYPDPETLEKHKKDGIVETDKLKEGVTLFVETIARIYEFKIEGESKACCKANGSEPFLVDTPCTLVGCVTEHGTLFASMIVHGLHLILATPRGRTVTGRVLTASVRGEGWGYELWKDLND
jgi:hypothetical protein